MTAVTTTTFDQKHTELQAFEDHYGYDSCVIDESGIREIYALRNPDKLRFPQVAA